MQVSVCKQQHVQLYVHSGVKNVVSEDVFNSKKEAAKRGRKPKSSGPSEFCSIILLCACFLLFAWGILTRHLTLYISAGNLFRRGHTVWHSSTTMSVTHVALLKLKIVCTVN